MKLYVEKRNPYHLPAGKNGGQFTSKQRLVGHTAFAGGDFKLGTSPLQTAKNLANLAAVDRKHVLARGNIAASILMHAHDMSANKALALMEKTAHPSRSYNSRRPFNLDSEGHKTELNAKPSSKEYKDMVAGRWAKDSAVYGRFLGNQVISKRSLLSVEALHLLDPRTSLADVKHLQKIDKPLRSAANWWSVSPGSPALALYASSVAKESMKAKLKSRKPGDNFDHIIPKGMFYMGSKQAADWINRPDNFQWMKERDNKEKQNGLVNRSGKKRNYDKLKAGDIKHMSYEALLVHSQYEKKYKHKFIAGGITPKMLADAQKTRSRVKWLKSVAAKAEKVHIKWEHS